MNGLWIVAGAAFMAALILLKKLRCVEQWLARERFARMDRVVRGVEQTNAAYFRSLEAMLRTLESLRAQTEETEHRLRDIVAQPAAERRDRRQTRGADGAASARRAATLKVPAKQRNQRQPRARAGAHQSIAARNGAVDSTGSTSLAFKPMRSAARVELAAESRGDASSGDNKKNRLNGAAE